MTTSSTQQRKIYEKKYQLLINQLPPLLLALQPQHDYELLMPYILDAFRHPHYGVRCIYAFFNPVATVLGPDEARKQLLPLIQLVLNPDRTTIHHWRCFTRRFIIQLIARFGLNKFLASFPFPLIEASSGFKDDIFVKAEADDDTSNTSDSNTDVEFTLAERTESIIEQDYEGAMFEVV